MIRAAARNTPRRANPLGIQVDLLWYHYRAVMGSCRAFSFRDGDPTTFSPTVFKEISHNRLTLLLVLEDNTPVFND
jgi:hypothetical protein